MSIALQLILSTALVATPAACSWAHPGANPYRGDPVHTLADFDLPASTREKLRALMAAHRWTDVASITRDDIAGAHGYDDLREMHSGHGQVCHGPVDRSAWSAARRERGLVYCADDACVIVPTICNNVSLVTRRPERDAVLDDTPIDISPAAGPPAPTADTPAAPPSDVMSPTDFLPTPVDDTPGGGGGSPTGGAPGGGFPGGGSPGSGGGGFPIGGGGLPCCEVGPGVPGSPPITPPSAVPEAPTWALLLAGLAMLAASTFRPGRAAGARAPATVTRRTRRPSRR